MAIKQGGLQDTKHGDLKLYRRLTKKMSRSLMRGIIFFNDYTSARAAQLSPSATYANGSRSMTSTRSTPGSYYGPTGIRYTADDNMPRVTHGIWTSTGFDVAQPGIIIERTTTNYCPNSEWVLDSDGNGRADGLGITTGSSIITGTPTYSLSSASDVSSTDGAQWQRVQYTGIAESGKSYGLSVSASCPTTSGTSTTCSMIMKGSTSGCNVKLQRITRSGSASAWLGTSSSSAFTISDTPILISYSVATADGSSKSITAFADGGGGTVTVTTSASHGFSTNNSVLISGTTNYNGTFTVSVIDATHFSITATWVSDDATGTCYWLATNCTYQILIDSIDENDTFDISFNQWQIEVGSEATSHIPTISSSVTRNSDLSEFSVTNNVVMPSGEGTIFVKGSYQADVNNYGGLFYTKGSGSSRIYIYRTTTSVMLSNIANTVTITGTTTIDNNTIHTSALTYNGSISKLYVDGVQEGGDSSTYTPSGEDQSGFRIGRNSSNASTAVIIQKVLIYNRVLSDTEVAEVTALL